MAEEATPGSVGRGINTTKQALTFLCYFSERRNNIIILNNLDSEKIASVSGGCPEARWAADASSAAALPGPRPVLLVQDSGEARRALVRCVSDSHLGSKTPALCLFPVCVFH